MLILTLFNLSHPHPTSPSPALGVIPPRETLSHIAEIRSGSNDGTNDAGTRGVPIVKSMAVSIGPGLPPVPLKIINKIEAGDFIDMDELLPERLGCPMARGQEDQFSASKPKRRSVSSILEWIQCFSVYMAVISCKRPDRIQDLLGYQSLILEAHLEYAGDSWLGYDRRFRLAAAANQNTTWAVIDPTLWSLAFAGKAKAARCKYCFSITHSSVDCEWAPDSQSMKSQHVGQRPRHHICFKWNNAPGASLFSDVNMSIYAYIVLTTLLYMTKPIKLYIAPSSE